MLRSVTAEDVRKVILTHVLNLFDPIKALCVCVTGDVARMRHELRSRSVEILTLKDCIHKTAVVSDLCCYRMYKDDDVTFLCTVY
jgi:hypothetical protein